jgi:riboflavin kinase/FMN adenylyltransferase
MSCDMRIITHWKDLPQSDRGACVALGNFDGVHKGHQKVIQLAADAARAQQSPLGVISFEPHPRRLFHTLEPAFRLTTIDQQSRALSELGVDRLYLLAFDYEMAGLSDEDFARCVLHEGLGIRHVAVGFDISFGKGRSGSPAAMTHYGDRYGFGVSVAEAVGEGVEKYSSTAVRAALRDGLPDRAAAMLGRPFAIEGIVRKGKQLGRQLGIPTANVPLSDYVTPKLGVYATRTRVPDGRWLPGVANIGVNPTTGGEDEARLEVWLFDIDIDLYGEVIETQLISFLRPEQKFESLDLMMEQIHRDEAAARTLLSVGG